MAFSSVGCAKVLCRFTSSCTSLAPARARALAIESSNAALTALAFRLANFSNAANWFVASDRSASMLALVEAWICSGVTYIWISLISVGWVFFWALGAPQQNEF